jgi:hypothetical protein
MQRNGHYRTHRPRGREAGFPWRHDPRTMPRPARRRPRTQSPGLPAPGRPGAGSRYRGAGSPIGWELGAGSRDPVGEEPGAGSRIGREFERGRDAPPPIRSAPHARAGSVAHGSQPTAFRADSLPASRKGSGEPWDSLGPLRLFPASLPRLSRVSPASPAPRVSLRL